MDVVPFCPFCALPTVLMAGALQACPDPVDINCKLHMCLDLTWSTDGPGITGVCANASAVHADCSQPYEQLTKLQPKSHAS